MCFAKNVRSRVVPKPLKAKKDIIVYKELTAQMWGAYRNLEINGRYERWERGFIYYETTPFATAYTVYACSDYTPGGTMQLRVYGHAFHSNIKPRKYDISSYEEHKMIIPKGSLYYKNRTEYVSSALHFPEKEPK